MLKRAQSPPPALPPQDSIRAQVTAALAEDIGSGDVTSALLDPDTQAKARLICREAAVLCGVAWFEMSFRQVDEAVQIHWQHADGDQLQTDAQICEIRGPARSILTAERTAINFLQTLSATATTTADYVQQVAGTGARILDTRKTLPGLRSAQKYAVTVGGGHNHRMGLFDQILLKENHIAAAGGIAQALARSADAGVAVEIEVENLDQLAQALAQRAQRILLDNFSLQDMRQAVATAGGRARLEVSGGVSLAQIRAIAETGVDDISVGGLSKHVRAVDFSLQFVK